MIFSGILKHARRLPKDRRWAYVRCQVWWDIRYRLCELRALVDRPYRRRREATKAMIAAMVWEPHIGDPEMF